MKLSERVPIRCCLLFCALSAGSAALASEPTGPPNSRPAQAASSATPAGNPQTAAIRRVSFSVRAAGPPPAGSSVSDPAFAGSPVLSVETLIEQVLARNPSLAQMAAAWQAASARYPQVTSLDDPMFAAAFAPASIGSNDVNFAYRLEIAQKFPFPGKRALRGQAALSEASAAGRDVEDMRLQLRESAAIAFYDYYLVDRALAVNAENLQLLKEIRQNAETRAKNLQAPQQDVLQADVEIGRQQERGLNLERNRQVVIARVNTLLHLPPDHSLPSPPRNIVLAEALPDAQGLRTAALSRRPDLQALSDRIAAEQATLDSAYREYYPDFEATAAYDEFWQGSDRDLRAQVGFRLNLPVRKTRRSAAVHEAQARVMQRRAELDRLTDQVNYQVQEAYAQVRESEKVVRLYEKTILPAAEANVKEAQSAYTTGKTPFVSLVEAQRNRVTLRDRFYEALADYHRRRATLERVIGGPLSPPGQGESNEPK